MGLRAVIVRGQSREQMTSSNSETLDCGLWIILTSDQAGAEQEAELW